MTMHVISNRHALKSPMKVQKSVGVYFTVFDRGKVEIKGVQMKLFQLLSNSWRLFEFRHPKVR